MELMVIFTTAFIVAFSGAMMPGPLLSVTIRESARRGFVAGPLLILGHAVLELALVLALAGGLYLLLAEPGVFRAIACGGGLFLLYMGIGMAGESRTVNLPLQAGMAAAAGQRPADMAQAEKTGTAGFAGWSLRLVLAGVLTSLANPYWTIWWATIGLGYITLAMHKGYAGLSTFFAGHILADLVWYSLVAAAVAGGRKFMSEGFYRGLLFLCGLFLLGLGIYFIYFGIFGFIPANA